MEIEHRKKGRRKKAEMIVHEDTSPEQERPEEPSRQNNEVKKNKTNPNNLFIIKTRDEVVIGV
jgi:hypothetical protein